MCYILQELALRWSISRAPRRSEQQTLGAFHLAAHFIGTGQLNDAKETTKTLRKVAPRSDAAKELAAMVTTALGEKPEVEMRIDASDGNPYPFSSFQEVYGPQVCTSYPTCAWLMPAALHRCIVLNLTFHACTLAGRRVLGDCGASPTKLTAAARQARLTHHQREYLNYAWAAKTALSYIFRT